MLHAFGLTHALSWNTPSWSVSAEWFAYLVLFTPIVLLLRRVSLGWLFPLGALLWAALLFGCPYFLGTSIYLTTSGFLRITPEFFCGYLLFRALRFFPLHLGDLCTLAGVGLLGVFVWANFSSDWLLVPAVMVLLGGLYRGGLLSDRLFGNRLMILLGEASYSIYLIQIFPIIVAHWLIHRIGTAHPSVAVCIAYSTVLLVAVCGLLCYRFIEEPLRKRTLRLLLPTAKTHS